MTTAKNLRIPDYLLHVLQAITQIETYAVGIEVKVFCQTKLLQDAIIRNIEIIGEAANKILRLDSDFEKKNPGLTLRTAIRRRFSPLCGSYPLEGL